jgi:hypothetical protein
MERLGQSKEQHQHTRIIAPNHSAYRYPWGTETYDESITHEVNDDHPEAASVVSKHSFNVELPGRKLTWEATLTFRSDLQNFYYSYTRRLLQGGKVLREKTWNDTIPRDFQ